MADIVRPPAGSGSTGLSGALRQVRRHFLNALLFSAFISVLYLSSSIYMMLVYDKVLNSGSFVTLVMITLALVFALGTLAYLDYIRGVLLQRAGMRLDRVLSGSIMQAVLRDAAQGDPRRKQLLRDWDQTRGMMTGQAAQALLDAPWAPLALSRPVGDPEPFLLRQMRPSGRGRHGRYLHLLCPRGRRQG